MALKTYSLGFIIHYIRLTFKDYKYRLILIKLLIINIIIIL